MLLEKREIWLNSAFILPYLPSASSGLVRTDFPRSPLLHNPLNYLPPSPGALRRVRTPTNQETVQGRTTFRSKERLTKPKRRRLTLRQGIGSTTVRPSLPPHPLPFLSSLLRWTGF